MFEHLVGAVSVVVEFVLALLQTAAACSKAAHLGGDMYLPLVAAVLVERGCHQVVERLRHLVHPNACQHSPTQQVLRIELIDHADTRHNRSAVGGTQALADMDMNRLQTAFCQYLRRITPLPVVMYLALADKAERDMRQLYQVAARTHAAVLRHEGNNAAIDELGKQIHYLGMHTALCLQERTQTGNHGGTHIAVVKRLARTRRVAANDVVLQVGQVLIIHTPLRHGPKAGVDTIDDLVACELLQETVT